MSNLKRSFDLQRNTAKFRGVAFELTFEQWLEIWKSSGKLEYRGHGLGKYVMARPGDVGPYSIENVKIITFEENAQEAHAARMLGRQLSTTRWGKKLTHQGKTLNIYDWARHLGISMPAFRDRIRRGLPEHKLFKHGDMRFTQS